MLIAPSLLLLGQFLLYQFFDERFQHALREHFLQALEGGEVVFGEEDGLQGGLEARTLR